MALNPLSSRSAQSAQSHHFDKALNMQPRLAPSFNPHEGDHLALIIPANKSPVAQQLIGVKAGRFRSQFWLAAKKYDLIEGSTKVDLDDSSYEALLLTPKKLAPSGFWREAGVADWNMQDRANFVDINNLAETNAHFDRFAVRFPAFIKAITAEAIISNRFGETVLDLPIGRAIITKDGEAQFARNDPDNQGRYFLSPNAAAFNECAAIIAVSLLRGNPLDNPKLDELMAKADIPFELKEDLREEIEAQITKRLATPNALAAPDRSSVRADDNLPILNGARNGERVIFQQYSTPFPLAAAAHMALDFKANDRVLEPSIGNGTLAAYAIGAGARITGVELSDVRYDRISRVHSDINIIRGDFFDVAPTLDTDFTVVLANPPFETLTQPLETELEGTGGRSFTTNKLDVAMAVQALEKVAAGPDGRAFVILPADMMKSETLSRDIDRFYLYANVAFDHVSAVRVDGNLYRKMGTQYPVVAFAMSGKRAPEDYSSLSEANAKKKPFQSIKDWDALFAWANSFAQTRQNLLSAVVEADQADIEPDFIAPATDDTIEADREPNQEQDPTQPVIDEDSDLEQEPEPELSIAEPAAPVPQGQLTEIELFNDLQEDALTTRYDSASRLGEATTVVQKSLQGLINQSLRNVEIITDMSVDEYVSSKLALDPDQLGKRCSVEQIDALALAFNRKEQGRGFLNSDLMGVGKGRFLAACTLEALAAGDAVIFMTEKPTLFQDFFYRDIPDVADRPLEELLGNTLNDVCLINQTNSSVKDPETGKAILSTTARTVNEWRDRGLPPTSNVAALTYSQFQSDSGAWKLQALKDWVSEHRAQGRNVTIITDEAHIAAGELSTSGKRTTELVDHVCDNGGWPLYSSATPLKSGKNIKLYSHILPDTGLTTEALSMLIEKNPLALQEIISMEIAREGGMISREIDFSNAPRQFVQLQDIDADRYSQIRIKVDQAAEFLAELMVIAEDAREEAAYIAQRQFGGYDTSGVKLKVDTTSPVSQFHTYSQYLMLAVKGAYAQELTAQSLIAGEKVVLAVDQTAAALLKDMALDNAQPEDGKLIFDQLPNIGDVLSRMGNSIAKAKVTTGFGEPTEIELPHAKRAVEQLSESINRADFSILNVCPLDQLRATLEAVGIPSDELTGRKNRLERTEDGRWEYVSWEQQDKNKAVASFNDGDLDVVFINQVASSGISMHASPKIGRDLRPRTMIKLQIQKEITKERQIEGRIGRFGQVHPPRYLIPMSGFAADDRLCQLFNRNNRNLTSTSNASRENATNITESLDLFNPVGRVVAHRYLVENQPLAARLGLADEEGSMDTVRKLIGRLVCLPLAFQDKVLADLDAAYQLELESLTARGINPLKLPSYNWNAEIIEKAILLRGDDKAASMGAQPIKLVELQYKEFVKPLSFDDIKDMAHSGLEAWINNETGLASTPKEALAANEWFKTEDGKTTIDFSHPIFDHRFNREDGAYLHLLGTEGSIKSDEANAIYEQFTSSGTPYHEQLVRARGQQERNTKIVMKAALEAQFVKIILDHFQIGKSVELHSEIFPSIATARLAEKIEGLKEEGRSNPLSRVVPATIVGISRPRKGFDPIKLSNWSLQVAVPGEPNTLVMSFAGILDAYYDYANTAFEKGAELDYHIATPDLIFDVNTHQKSLSHLKLTISELEDGWKDRIGSVVDVTDFEALMKKMFDAAPGGAVPARKTALMGNLFMAMEIAGKSVSEKAIFTDANGDTQHAILLKNGKQKEILQKLTLSAATIPVSITGDHALEKARAATRIYATMAQRMSNFYVARAEKLNSGSTNPTDLEIEQQTKQVITDLAILLGEPESNRFKEVIRSSIASIFDQLATSVSSKVPSMIVLGQSGRSFEDLEAVMTQPLEACFIRPTELVEQVNYVSGLNEKSIILLPPARVGTDATIVLSRKNKLIKSEFSSLAHDMRGLLTKDKWSGYKIKGGALSIEHHISASAYKQGMKLVERHIEVNQTTINAYGGLRDIMITLPAVKANLMASIAREALAEKDNTPIEKPESRQPAYSPATESGMTV